MIEAKTPIIQSNGNVRVELFQSFIGDFGRKVYIVAGGATFQFPRGCAHSHATADCLAPISGDIWLAYKTSQGKIEYMQLVPGCQYVIPPYIPHQLEIRGGVLEALTPTKNYTDKLKIYESVDSFFRKDG